jgi:hypothetical protein
MDQEQMSTIEKIWLAALDRNDAGNPIATALGPHTVQELRLNLKRSGGHLSTEHAASSYGIPVLIIDDVAYGPAESHEAITRAIDDRAEQLIGKEKYTGGDEN